MSDSARAPALPVALAPLVLVIAGNHAFTAFVIPAMDTTYLADPRFGPLTLDAVFAGDRHTLVLLNP